MLPCLPRGAERRVIGPPAGEVRNSSGKASNSSPALRSIRSNSAAGPKPCSRIPVATAWSGCELRPDSARHAPSHSQPSTRPAHGRGRSVPACGHRASSARAQARQPPSTDRSSAGASQPTNNACTHSAAASTMALELRARNRSGNQLARSLTGAHAVECLKSDSAAPSRSGSQPKADATVLSTTSSA